MTIIKLTINIYIYLKICKEKQLAFPHLTCSQRKTSAKN
jgi:hypothetical protein